MIITPEQEGTLRSMGFAPNSSTASWNKPGPDGAPRAMLWWTGVGERWTASLPGRAHAFADVVTAAVWTQTADSTP